MDVVKVVAARPGAVGLMRGFEKTKKNKPTHTCKHTPTHTAHVVAVAIAIAVLVVVTVRSPSLHQHRIAC